MAKTILLRSKRRKHQHFAVTIKYFDGETFLRVYTDEERAAAFAQRQAKSPVVKHTSVRPLN